VLRGGSWNFSATFSRSARRFWNTADTRYYDNGFRIARTLD
jgi:formylglycine-generating enzyme required for sulfatase activity